MANLKIAVLIPCLNEALSIQETIRGFKAALPCADIYIGDNNSDDNTANIAKNEGANVITVMQKGKGSVIKKMFKAVNADIYVMADGDATYDAPFAPKAVKTMIEQKLDFVTVARISTENANYRRGHKFGNFILTKTFNIFFGGNFKDIMSGYRFFSNKFVKSFAGAEKGFGVEPEIVRHGVSLNYLELEAPYFSRKAGSVSKLSTCKDGIIVLRAIFKLLFK